MDTIEVTFGSSDIFNGISLMDIQMKKERIGLARRENDLLSPL
jgi:hypothetical protein